MQIYYFFVASFYASALLFAPLFLSLAGCTAPAAAQSPGAPKAPALEVLSVTPGGESVDAGSQIVIQFSEPMVELGKMEVAPSRAPVEIEPVLPCEWRWLDPSRLSCRLQQNGTGQETTFTPATEYRIRVVAARVESLAGHSLTADHLAGFSTTRPRIVRAQVEAWQGPGSPSFHVQVNQPVRAEALRRALRLTGASVDHPLVVSPMTWDQSGLNWQVDVQDPLPRDVDFELRSVPGLVGTSGPLPGVESKQLVDFATFPEPELIGVECYDEQGRALSIPTGDEVDAGALSPCQPSRRVSLVFATPMAEREVTSVLEASPELAFTEQAEDDYTYRTRRFGAHQRGRRYPMALPSPMRVVTDYHIVIHGASLRDVFGQPLGGDVSVSFRTGHLPPNVGLRYNIAVLESQVPTHLPLVVTNLDRASVRFESSLPETIERDTVPLVLPEAEDVAVAIPLKVRDWLEGNSGVVDATIEIAAGDKEFDALRLWAQVTPFSVHAKRGHRNTTVWVTDLASGLPVAGARVTLRSQENKTIDRKPRELAEATTDDDGVALLPGNAEIDPLLSLKSWRRPLDSGRSLYVHVERDGATALLPLTYDFRVYEEGPADSWIGTSSEYRHGHLRAWGTTAQGIYRRGSKVEFKLWVRDEDNERLVPAPAGTFDLTVIDPQGKTVHEEAKIRLSDFGTFDGEFRVPERGAMGWYRVELRYRADPDEKGITGTASLQPFRVLVADFTPAPFRVETELAGDAFEVGDQVQVETLASLHSGGPYTDASTRITARLFSLPIVSSNPRATGFRFGDGSGATGSRTLFEKQLELDKQGRTETEFELLDLGVYRGRLMVESAVRDDRGKSIAGAATAIVYGRDRFVGLHSRDWLLTVGEDAVLEAVVVDRDDQLEAGVPVGLEIERLETRAARVKGAGNAYVTQYQHQWVATSSCRLESADIPVECRFLPDHPGRYRMTASIADSRGRRFQTVLHSWAVGAGEVMWETVPGFTLSILPEKDVVSVGDTARFLIQNPFPGARALCSTERLGVIEHWSEVFESSTEVIELEVTPDHTPGFYFSCVVTSPRVESPPGERGDSFAAIDLGKPAVRQGYVKMTVNDRHKEIDVEVVPAKEIYRPRDKVEVALSAREAHPSGRSAGDGESGPDQIELAVAVLDEAVFDLLTLKEAAYDPYRGLYDLGALDVENFNLLTRLVGLQNFDKKGANAGGGGGAGDVLRSLFRFVAYWNPSLVVEQGEITTIDFDAPDNLTGWRVLVMAATPGDRFGLGQGTFKVNRPVELRPALPNQVTAGDTFDARFTIMNRTSEPRVFTVEASVEGPVVGGRRNETFEIAVDPYERVPFSVGVETFEPGRLRFEVTAEARPLLDQPARGQTVVTDLPTAGGTPREVRDALLSELEVHPYTVFETASEYGSFTEEDDSQTTALRLPDGIVPSTARASVVLSPTVIGDLEGVFRFARDYPYGCWEQRLSQGLIALRYTQLRDYLPEDLTWPAAREMPQSVIEMAAEFQAPNGGMTYWNGRNESVSPYLSAYTALAFVWMAEGGSEIPESVEKPLQSYLQELLRRDRFPDYYGRRMSASVRAVALAALALRGRAEQRDLERYRRLIPDMSLFGRALYLRAALALDSTELVRELETGILSTSDSTAGKLVFSESLDGSFAHMHSSPARTQCAVLDSLLASFESAGRLSPALENAQEDRLMALMRAVRQERKGRHHWRTTQENAFCLNAMAHFSRVMEKQPVAVSLRASVELDRSSDVRSSNRELRGVAKALDMGTAELDGLRSNGVTLDVALPDEWAGRGAELEVSRRGSGRVYFNSRLTWASETAGEANAGISVIREYSLMKNGAWVRLESPILLERGDLVRVDLFLDVPAARYFVVVDDPVPGGLEPVNRDLATASTVDADSADLLPFDSYWHRYDDWINYGLYWSGFYHRELGHDAARFYSDYLGRGHYHLSYAAQVVATGEFRVAPARAEEMYDPDVFGRSRPNKLITGEGSAAEPEQ